MPTLVVPSGMDFALVESPALPDRPVIVGAVLSVEAAEVPVTKPGSLTMPRVESES